jgi:hypothetical protein
MKKTSVVAFKAGSTSAWTRERLDQLDKQELLNLRTNADRLGESELTALCDEVIKQRPKRGPQSNGAASPRKNGKSKKLLSRSAAFGARGVFLTDPRTSWSGIRKTDGGVVLAIWQAAVQTTDGACSCLLWAPNVDGARAWSDSAAGRERLEHCKVAMQRHGAQGLLVQGEPLEGRLPEDRARTVLGIDADTTVEFQVELRGKEYWASWGKKERKSP